MPIVNVRWSTETEPNQKQEIIDYIVDTVSETVSTKKELIYVFFHEYDAADVSNPGCPVVQINWTAQPVRNAEAKAVLIKKLADKFAEYPNVNAKRAVIIITDTPLDSAGVGGVTRATSLD